MEKKYTELKIAGIITGIGAVLFAVPTFLMAPGKPSKAQRDAFTNRNFAHRGLHTEDKVIPENSMTAFKRAVEKGYGIELDVQLSKDGKVVVFHDDTLERVCHVDGYVKDYTFAELRTMRICDTEEQIPLFTDVLGLISGKVPLIVELKSTKNRNELCQKTLDILKAYAGTYCIESFDPFIVAWFKRHAPEILRGQLALPADGYKNTAAFPAWGMSHCILNFLTRPQFIAYQIGHRPFVVHLMRKAGAMLIGWTAHDTKAEKKNDAVIFEFTTPEIRY